MKGKVKVQDEQGPATGQAKQITGSAGNEQDRKRQGTGRAGSSYRTGKTKDQQAMHRTGRVKVQDDQGPATGQENKVQDQQVMHRTGSVKVQDDQGPAF